MKNFFVMIFFTAFIFLSAGCGENSAVNDIKETAETAVENKVDEVKKDAASKVENVANEVSRKAAQIANDKPTTSAEEIVLAGISPGMTFAEVKNILGEPVSSHDDDEFIFADGVEVEFDDHRNIVKEIKARQNGVTATGGIAVGMSEQNLLDALGNAARIDHDKGGVEYKYFSNDRTKKIEFRIFNGVITEIKCELYD